MSRFNVYMPVYKAESYIADRMSLLAMGDSLTICKNGPTDIDHFTSAGVKPDHNYIKNIAELYGAKYSEVAYDYSKSEEDNIRGKTVALQTALADEVDRRSLDEVADDISVFLDDDTYPKNHNHWRDSIIKAAFKDFAKPAYIVTPKLIYTATGDKVKQKVGVRGSMMLPAIVLQAVTGNIRFGAGENDAMHFADTRALNHFLNRTEDIFDPIESDIEIPEYLNFGLEEDKARRDLIIYYGGYTEQIIDPRATVVTSIESKRKTSEIGYSFIVGANKAIHEAKGNTKNIFKLGKLAINGGLDSINQYARYDYNQRKEWQHSDMQPNYDGRFGS